MFRTWRRLDHQGLELAQIDTADDSVKVSSTLIDCGPRPYVITYGWELTPDWRTRVLTLKLRNHNEPGISIVRAGPASWLVDGMPAKHLDGCEELDVSATPFCNALAIRLLCGDGVLQAAYIDAGDLSIQPSRQRYERIGPSEWRYHDLGVANGFTARLMLDAEGLVASYEGLFEVVDEPVRRRELS